MYIVIGRRNNSPARLDILSSVRSYAFCAKIIQVMTGSYYSATSTHSGCMHCCARCRQKSTRTSEANACTRNYISTVTAVRRRPVYMHSGTMWAEYMNHDIENNKTIQIKSLKWIQTRGYRIALNVRETDKDFCEHLFYFRQLIYVIYLSKLWKLFLRTFKAHNWICRGYESDSGPHVMSAFRRLACSW